MPPALMTLPPDALRRACDFTQFDFETTADLPELQEVLGQPRAVEALEFGVSIASHGFNLFALGLPGSGKTTLIREYLERQAAAQSVPGDLCYVNNFEDARQPVALHLPAGQAGRFKRDVAQLVAELREALPRAFAGKEYGHQRDQTMRDFEEKRRQEFSQLEAQVEANGFRMIKAPGGLLLVPALNGKAMSERDLEKLSPRQEKKLVGVRLKLEAQVEASLRTVRQLERSARDALGALDRETAAYATRHSVADLRSRYQGSRDILAYLDALQADVIEHLDLFRGSRDTDRPGLPLALAGSTESQFVRYQVNVLVDHHALEGAPVVVESNPTYHNLVGRVEHQAVFGAVTTDFTMIKAGALHRANGGYLIVPARECLLHPYAWEGFKRALKDSQIRIEEIGSQLGLMSTVTLEPEPVPLDVKVVLIGSPGLYYLLLAHDEDFQKLFKVKADFTTEMDRTPGSERAYGLFVRTITQQDQALAFDREAVARVVEYGARLAGDQDKLSTRFGEIADLVREAAHWAAQHARPAASAEDVRQAEDARRHRQNLVEERLQHAIADQTVLIDTDGKAVGRVNGLSVVSLGDYSFGHPSRITATAGPGRGGVISIEREVELSGPVHGKGVLILGGFLNQKYGQAGPLGLSAQLVFEQTYGWVEGDSASLAELYALLSALAGLPLQQGIAVTGSVNQHGQVQAVGGVTEKIEGFFEVCQAKGLTGRQGVLIPASNRRHLMLREEVIGAVRAGRFNIWAAEDVDAGLPLLTGRAAGETGADGRFPAGSLHRAVADRLAQYAEMLKAQAALQADGRARVP